jgi:hypothetical protein
MSKYNTLKGKPYWRSKESHDRAIAQRRNRIVSEETRIKIRESLSRFYSKNGGRPWSIGRQDTTHNPMWKRKHTEESKRRTSLAMKNYWEKRRKHGDKT